MYKPLEIDFEIPEILQEEIDALIDDLNNNNGKYSDCYIEEIRSTLNCCDTTLSLEQRQLLRRYYYNGGIYENT